MGNENKQIQNVKVVVNNNTEQPKRRKPRKKPQPPPPDVVLPTPKLENWKMGNAYPVQPISYPLPVTQIFPERSTPPAYFEGHLTNMQNTLKDLREGFNTHIQDLREELMQRASTQQQAAVIERIVRDVAVQHEQDLTSIGVGRTDSTPSSMSIPFSSPPPSSPPSFHDNMSVINNPFFNDDGGNDSLPDAWSQGQSINVSNIPSSHGSLGSRVSGHHGMTSVGSGPGFSDGGGSAGNASRVSGHNGMVSSVGSGSGFSDGGSSGHGSRVSASGGSSSSSGGGGGGSGVASNHPSNNASTEHGEFSRVYGESEDSRLMGDNESVAGGGIQRAIEEASLLWREYNETTSKYQKQRLATRIRAIGNSWGVDTNGRIRTVLNRIIDVQYR